MGLLVGVFSGPNFIDFWSGQFSSIFYDFFEYQNISKNKYFQNIFKIFRKYFENIFENIFKIFFKKNFFSKNPNLGGSKKIVGQKRYL